MALAFRPLPGTDQFSSVLQEQIRARELSRGAEYRPRTRHLDNLGRALYTNRLFLESSPYLLQHAHNPVNWFSWSDEAFAEALRTDRPVFLSVGYATCHWCHVMEEESFEDEGIAEYLNTHFVSIKVDREERPDVDALYMNAVLAMTGHGGWPMTVFLTPDKKPFFGGTYFPPQDNRRHGHVGFHSLLQHIHHVYKNDRSGIEEASGELQKLIQQSVLPPPATDAPSRQCIEDVVVLTEQRFDRIYGGFSGAPKFPSSFPIRLVLRQSQRTGDEEAMLRALYTLERMACGGIYDQLAGGFHRYSTDEKWLIPHFEKMLYDNALLVIAYTEAWQLSRKPLFHTVITQTLDYVLREMTSPDGAFYSATDADSVTPSGVREEGWYFTWTPEEIQSVLEPTAAQVFTSAYGVTNKGNFEGRNVLARIADASTVARDRVLEESQVVEMLDRSREKLLAVRQQRPAPLRDEKILTAWNGLMISAFARAGFALDRSDYIDVATRAAYCIQHTMLRDGRLFRTSTGNIPRIAGYLEDYAAMSQAFLDLFEVTSDPSWLKLSRELDAVLERHFEDKEHGGFFATADDHEKLIAREKPSHDGATPSGNSIAALNLFRLFEFTNESSYKVRGEQTLIAFSSILQRSGAALSEMLLAVDYSLSRPKQIAFFIPDPGDSEAKAFLGAIRKTFIPNRTLLIIQGAAPPPELSTAIPWVAEKTAQQATAFVCIRGRCELPAYDIEAFAQRLQDAEKSAP